MLEVKQKVWGKPIDLKRVLRFNPCYAGSKIESEKIKSLCSQGKGFNPCYAGSKIERQLSEEEKNMMFCFNPCYAGSKIESRLLS